jgi:hypothetical protein
LSVGASGPTGIVRTGGYPVSRAARENRAAFETGTPESSGGAAIAERGWTPEVAVRVRLLPSGEGGRFARPFPSRPALADREPSYGSLHGCEGELDRVVEVERRSFLCEAAVDVVAEHRPDSRGGPVENRGFEGLVHIADISAPFLSCP